MHLAQKGRASCSPFLLFRIRALSSETVIPNWRWIASAVQLANSQEESAPLQSHGSAQNDESLINRQITRSPNHQFFKFHKSQISIVSICHIVLENRRRKE